MACAKHFVGNEHETYRRNSSSNIPEEALFEIYIEPFYKAIKKVMLLPLWNLIMQLMEHL